MRRIQKYLIEFFGFSNEESRGFIIFSCLVLIIFATSKVAPSILFQKDDINYRDSENIKAFLDNVIPKKTSGIDKDSHKRLSISDPNTMSFLDWEKLGLDHYLADRIISYRLKGGRFNVKEDLKKIYGLSDSVYTEISEFLSVSDKNRANRIFKANKKGDFSSYQPQYKKDNPKTPLRKPDINSCDSTELLFIKGIGPSRASRIIKYRNKLGGFTDKNQLSEVYGLDSTVLANLQYNTIIKDSVPISKININATTFKELINHPYIDYNTCKVILNYRKQHGPFNDIQDLEKIKIIDLELIQKINPYLEFL